MATISEIQQLYIAYFGRPADPAGLDYWVSTGISTKDFAAAMYAQPEFQQVNAGLSVSQQVNALYVNLFGREADVEGLTYWTQQINTGKLTLSSIANDLIYAANNSTAPQSVIDKAALDNKTATALTYTSDVRETSASFLAYNPTSTNPWVTGPQFASANAFLDTATATNTPDAAAIQASVNEMTAITPPGTTFTLTTGVDRFTGGNSNDLFDGSLTASGAQTLNAGDVLNGGGGLNTLDAVLIASVTPTSMANIQVFDITAQSGAVVLGMINAGQATTLINDGSTQNLTFSNVASSATDITVQNTGAVNTTIAYASPTSVTAVNLTLSNVTAGTTSLAGVETLNVVSSGAANTQDLAAAAATVINLSGSVAQTITLDAATVNVSSFNASAATANVNLTLINQTGVLASSAVSVQGGSGNDTLDVTLQTTSSISVTGGAGNDTFVFGANLATTDTVAGGDGIADILSATSAALVSTNTYTRISGVEQVTVSDALAGNVVLSQIQAGINTVNLSGVTGLSASTDAVITFDSGVAGTVNLSNNIGANTTTPSLTVAAAGAGLTDTATIANNNATGLNVFATATGNDPRNISATGVETLVIDTYGSGALAAQTIGTIGVTGSTGATSAETVNFVGANTVSTGVITADIINASGLTATTGTVFTTTIGTQNSSITGSSGNDSITSGTGNDSISGGTGNDTLTAATGNDTLLGGAGNDRVVFATAGDLTVADSVDGGEGVNTLSATAADITTNAALVDTVDLAALGRITNVTTLEVTGVGAGASSSVINAARVSSAINLVNTVAATGSTAATFTFNTGASTLNLGTGSTTGALGAATTFVATGTGTADSLTVVKNNTAAADDFASRALTLTGIETINFNVGAVTATTQAIGTIAFTPTTTNGNTTINVSGGDDATLAAVTPTGTGLLTINASGMTLTTGTVFNLTAPVTAGGTVSITGSAGNDVLLGDINDRNTIEGGAGNDTITGGSAADSLVGSAGIDSITGGGGNDTILAGDGADTLFITVAAADTLSVDGGAGNDVVTVTAFNELNATDIIRGGDGVDTFSVAVVNNTATSGAGVTEFETLTISTSGAASQAMTTVFTADTTLNRIDFSGTTGAKAITAASAALSQVRLISNTSLTVTRTTDTTTNALTVAALTDLDATIGTLTVNNEESLTLNQGGITTLTNLLAVNSLDAIDLTTLTIAGGQLTSVTLGASAAATGLGTTARGVTIDASAATNDVAVNAGTALATQALTMTGSSSASNLLTGGLGNDTITGGNASDTLVGGQGADVINGVAGVDTFSAVGMNADGADGGVAASVGAVVNLGATTLTAAAIATATGLRTASSTQAVASNTAAYLASAGSGGVGLATTVDTLANITNVIGSTGTDYIVGSASASNLQGDNGADTIVGGASADTITGGAGVDSLVGGLGADDFVYTATGQGGTAKASNAANAISVGDSITGFVSGTDDIDVSATATGGGAIVVGAGVGSAFASATDSLGIVNTDFDFSAASDSGAVATALDAAFDAANSGVVMADGTYYFAILDADGANPDFYNVFEVIDASGAGNLGTFADASVTISMIATVDATLVAGDFIV